MQLTDIETLAPLRNLVTLTLHGNPLWELPHARLFTVYHITALEVLDGESVEENERQLAAERFARGTVRT